MTNVNYKIRQLFERTFISETQKLPETTSEPTFPTKNIEDENILRKQVCPLSIHTINWQTYTGQEMFIFLCKSLLLAICCQVQISSPKFNITLAINNRELGFSKKVKYFTISTSLHF